MILADLWNWFAGLDWSRLDNIFSAIAGVTVLVGIAWAAVRFVFDPLSAWLNRRGAQAKLLDQLSCLSSVQFVESLFGPAKFITFENEREQRTYRLHGAWVMVELKDARVVAFSITVTNRRMYYKTKRLTMGFLKIKLGKDSFGDHESGYDGERLWIGAYRYGYLRTYDFRRSGGYQRFWLSHNMSGAGSFAVVDPSGDKDDVLHTYETGQLRGAHSQHRSMEPGLDASGTRINTLTVMHQDAGVPESDFLARDIHGIDEARALLASSTVKPPSALSARRKIWNRILLWKYKIQGKTFRP